MTNGTISDKQRSSQNFAKLAFVFGVISLAGMICCFPVMPVIGGLGIIFALISRGGAKAFAPDAKKGLTFSIIGTTASLLLTMGVLAYSVVFTMNELKTNDKFVDQMREQYEQLTLFTDYKKYEEDNKAEEERLKKEKNIQHALIDIKRRFGKNAILKGMNLEEGATARERNAQVGGHKA